MSNVQAAIGVDQLLKSDKFVEMGRENAPNYNERLSEVDGIQIPPEKSWARNNYWIYAITLDEVFPLDQDALMAELDDRGIGARRFFVPMHEQPVYGRSGLFEVEGDPVAEDMAVRGLY